MNKHIFFKILFLFLIISKITFAQNFGEIKGQVIDFENEKPLEGASIKIEGTNIGVSSDSNGYFKIENISTKTYNINITSHLYDFESLAIDLNTKQEFRNKNIFATVAICN